MSVNNFGGSEVWCRLIVVSLLNSERFVIKLLIDVATIVSYIAGLNQIEYGFHQHILSIKTLTNILSC